MNERIKELYSKVVAESENMRWNIEDAEKFAELIVRECADFVHYKAEKSMSQEIVYVGNDLLKHFGVE